MLQDFERESQDLKEVYQGIVRCRITYAKKSDRFRTGPACSKRSSRLDCCGELFRRHEHLPGLPSGLASKASGRKPKDWCKVLFTTHFGLSPKLNGDPARLRRGPH